MISAVRAVQAVVHVDAYQRKPPELKRVTFFSLEDIWHYIPVWDRVLCDKCLGYARTRYFVGKHLRAEMKYLKIIDENTIAANIHPHCRCILTRVTDLAEYLRVTALIWGGLPWT